MNTDNLIEPGPWTRPQQSNWSIIFYLVDSDSNCQSTTVKNIVYHPLVLLLQDVLLLKTNKANSGLHAVKTLNAPN